MEKEKSINEEGITYAKAENQTYEVNCKKTGMLGAHRARGQSRKKMEPSLREFKHKMLLTLCLSSWFSIWNICGSTYEGILEYTRSSSET